MSTSTALCPELCRSPQLNSSLTEEMRFYLLNGETLIKSVHLDVYGQKSSCSWRHEGVKQEQIVLLFEFHVQKLN